MIGNIILCVLAAIIIGLVIALPAWAQLAVAVGGLLGLCGLIVSGVTGIGQGRAR